MNLSDEEKLVGELLFAIRGQDVAVLERAVASGVVDLNWSNQQGATPLYKAAQADFGPGVRVLVNAGADIEKTDMDGETPLFRAAANGQANAVRVLLDLEANVDATDVHGRSPLFMSAYTNHPEITRILLDAGADTEIVTYNGEQTALMQAAKWCRADIMEALIDAGADIDRSDADGWTALHFACGFARRFGVRQEEEDVTSRWRCVRILLERGAKAHLVTKDGKLASDLHGDIPDELMKAMAEARDRVGKSVKAAR